MATSYVKKNADTIIALANLLAIVTWLLFVIGFGAESNNPDRLPSWSNSVEKFSWYLFCVIGLLAIISIFANMSYKKPLALALSQLFTALAMLFAGGPLDSTGHYLWDCREEDSNGDRFTGQGCQEATYDNMSLMFSAILLYAMAMCVVVYVTTMAPTTTRMTLRGANNVDLETNLA